MLYVSTRLLHRPWPRPLHLSPAAAHHQSRMAALLECLLYKKVDAKTVTDWLKTQEVSA